MYKYHRNTSTRNSGSDETVKDSLACAVTPNNGNQKDVLDRYTRRIQLVPSDQRSGRYYSGIYATQYYLLVLSEFARSHWFFFRSWHWFGQQLNKTLFAPLKFKYFGKDFFFFLPRIYMACWFISGHARITYIFQIAHYFWILTL